MTTGTDKRRAHAAPVKCSHCGLDVPLSLVRPGEELQFCCTGCSHVHSILHEWGFERYYDLLAVDPGKQQPSIVSGRGFEELDDETFLREHGRPAGRGAMGISFYLEGIHCAACVWVVEQLPRTVPGLLSVRVNLANARAEVEWDPSQVSLSVIARAFDTVGYTPHPHRDGTLETIRKREDKALLIRLGVSTACAMNIMFIHGALYAGEHHGIASAYETFFRWISFALAVPVAVWAAQPFYTAAAAGLRQRVPHMDLPISIAIIGAFAYSAVATLRGTGHVYFDSLTALVALLLGARYVQSRAQRAALERSDSLRSAAFVEYARRIADDGAVREVRLGSLAAGDRVEVRSGDHVPVDGLVREGTSALDNGVITGESRPAPVGPGDNVHAGATNLGARLVVEVEAVGADTRVGALLRLVDEAMGRRAPIVKLADRISRWFVLGVLVLAAATAIMWSGSSGEQILEHVVALLVVTCPCALGLATPVALTVALSKAARAGVFVKNPDIIETLPRVDVALLDKTGTLTEGRARVADWFGDDDAKALAVALERESAHPVAEALRAAFAQPLDSARDVTDVQESLGRGITGRVGGERVAVGNRALLDEAGVTVTGEWSDRATALAARGLSPVFVAVDGAVRALAGVGDPLRADARETMDAMRALGWRPQIVSGDHSRIVSSVAAELAIPAADAHGEMTPEEKRDRVAAAVAAQSEGGGSVLMVGDGVNDAAALALADVGVAVHGGSGASVVAADVVLTRAGVRPLADLARGARRTLWVVRRNLLFSLAYNILGAALAMTGVVGPLVAAVLMPLSSLTVILSSVLGRTFEAPRRLSLQTAEV